MESNKAMYTQLLNERITEYTSEESYGQVEFDGLKTLEEMKRFVEELIKLEEA